MPDVRDKARRMLPYPILKSAKKKIAKSKKNHFFFKYFLGFFNFIPCPQNSTNSKTGRLEFNPS